MKDIPISAALRLGRRHWRPSLAGAFVLLIVGVFADLPAQATAESPAHLAVWRVVDKRGTSAGTAFAIGERHFLTNAHVLQGIIDQGWKEIVLTQQGNAAELTVNYGHLALSLTYDLALFSTREEVEHILQLAPRDTGILGTGHRIVGYTRGCIPLEPHTVPRRASVIVTCDAPGPSRAWFPPVQVRAAGPRPSAGR